MERNNLSKPKLTKSFRAEEEEEEDIPKCLTYCVSFIVHTQFLNVAAGLIIQPGGPRVGDQYFRTCTVTI